MIARGGSRTAPPGESLGLAVVAKAARDDFPKHFACVGNKRDPSVAVATRTVLSFVKDLDDRIFLLLGDFSCYPSIGKDVVKALRECGVVELYRRPAGGRSGP